MSTEVTATRADAQPRPLLQIVQWNVQELQRKIYLLREVGTRDEFAVALLKETCQRGYGFRARQLPKFSSAQIIRQITLYGFSLVCHLVYVCA